MKVSIITVVYNNSLYIRQCIESVINQTHKNIEYIVIDGGSTDGTINIINEYISNISLFVSERDNGLYDAMNKGIRLANGDLIGFLNSDDLFESREVIENIVAQFEKDSGLGILFGDLVYVKQSNTNQVVRTWKSKDYNDHFFEHANVPPHPSLYVKNEVYKQIDLFNLQFKLAADYELMLRLFKKYSFKIVHFKMVIVRMRLGGVTSKNWENRIKQNKEIKEAWSINGLRLPIYFFPLRIVKKILQYL